MALSTLLHDPRIKIIVGVCSPYDLAENLDKSFIHGRLPIRLFFKFFGPKIPKHQKGTPSLMDLILEKAHKVSPSEAIQSDYDYTNRVFLAHSKVDEVLPYDINFLPNVEKMRLPPEQTIIFERGGHEMKGQVVALLCRVVYWLQHYL
jgi:hypothetical protein